MTVDDNQGHRRFALDKVTRRQLVKGGAIAGGLVWVAPAVSSIDKAFGAAVGSPSPSCTCRTSGYDVFASGLVGVSEIKDAAGGCIVNVNVLAGTGGASALCTVGNGCTATSQIASANVNGLAPISVGVVSSSATQTSDGVNCTTHGTTQIAGLVLGGNVINIPNPVPCNFSVLPLPAGIASVILNEQSCDPTTGQFTVTAIHITLSTLQQIYIAQSQVVNVCCGGKCVTCA